MEKIEEILSSYGIKPIMILKITDQVHKIDDGQHQYALKKSVLNQQTVQKWERVFHDAHQRQLSSILSLFLTTNNSLYTIFDRDYYYLMPWINGEQSTIEQLYRSIGNIHKTTQQPQTVDHDQMVHQFSRYKQYCDEALKRLLSYVKQFESHIYMAPLELQVCTHYRDIELAIIKIREQIIQLTSSQGEQKNWSYSLCHGNLKLSHSLKAGQTYYINWERTKYDYPVTDLVMLFKNELIRYDAPIETWIDLFKTYLEENQLQHHELSLLLIYLLDPTDYMKKIQQYIEETSNQSMINQIKAFENTYRQLLFGLRLSDFIEKNYFSIIESDLEN